MKQNVFKNKNILKSILCFVLIAVMALTITSCSQTKDKAEKTTTTAAATEQANVLGEGKTSFAFSVTDKDGKTTDFTINTDKKIVGDALIEQDLIAGEDSAYGLYVKTVNGQTLDYEKDGKYWAFYVNGEYGATGVDSTEITDGAEYAFKAE